MEFRGCLSLGDLETRLKVPALPREPLTRIDRAAASGSMSRAIGLYQTLLRRALEHFLPDATLESGGDRSFIHFQDGSDSSNYRCANDPEGFGLEIEWFRTPYLLLPGSPSPFLPSEQRLIGSILRLLDDRFRTLFDLVVTDFSEMFHFANEDLIITEYLSPPARARLPAALEALRAAAMTTYENRRVTTGALLLGTSHDPAAPLRANNLGAPSYNIRLAGIKGFHRLCDGVRTLFLVDYTGDLIRVIDIHSWADQIAGDRPLPAPCPRAYQSHARSTLEDNHISVVLTPAQEIKLFHRGAMAFAYSDARWRMLDIPSKFSAWCEAVGPTDPPELAEKVFQAALNLAEDRKGALFVVLRDPSDSADRLIAPCDRIVEEVAIDDPQDPENLSPKLAKRSLHHVVRGQSLADLDLAVLEALGGIDGAVVTDRAGRLWTFGAILRVDPETFTSSRAVEGARTLASVAASYDGPVLKVSEDGYMTMFLGGRKVWTL